MTDFKDELERAALARLNASKAWSVTHWIWLAACVGSFILGTLVHRL